MILLEATLGYNRQTQSLRPGKSTFFEALYVDYIQETVAGGMRHTAYIHPKQDVLLDHLELVFQLPATPPDRFFADGFQSRSLCMPTSPGTGRSTEAGNTGLTPKPTHHCGWTYAWAQAPKQGWRFEGQTVRFLFWGALQNTGCFTYFQYEAENNRLRVRADLGGLHLAHSYPALDLWTGSGNNEREVFDRWMEAAERPKPARKPMLAWTSSGLQQPLNEQQFTSVLNDLSTSGLPFQWIMMADGWQNRTGDWRKASDRFPSGMGAAAQAVHRAGMKACVELSPFVAARDADVVRQFPEAVVKNTRGNPVLTADGHCILQFYHGGVQDYLNGVLHVLKDQWQFDGVRFSRLDVLAASVPEGKTRGQVVAEALDFLRKGCGNMQLWVDHVPLGSAPGVADVVRVCPEPMVPAVSGWSKFLPWKPKPDVFSGLKTALARWPLHGRAWVSDLGCFSLQDARWLPQHQETALLLQALLGGLLQTSDNPALYTDEQRCELEEALVWQHSTLLSVDYPNSQTAVLEVEADGSRYTVYVNFSDKTVQAADNIALMPWESLVLLNSN